MRTNLCIILWLVSPSTLAFDINTNKNAKYFADKGMQHANLFPGLTSLCDIDSPIRDLSQGKRRASASNNNSRPRSPAIPPTKVFDNLYYVGTSGVSSWLLRTSDGLILIDALNSNRQAEDYIEKGMITLGLKPEDIKYLIIGHEHGDHYGGQENFVRKYQTKVVMSDVAWSRMENNELTVFSPRWGAMPKRSITAKDGDIISLGDTEVQIYETPGHTPGTISLIFPVYDNGKKHMLSFWGGTSLNFGADLARIKAYTEAASRFGEIVKKQNVDIFISNHPRTDGSAEKIRVLAERKESQAHPFVQGQSSVAKAYDMLASCTQAQVLRIKQQQYE